MQIDQILDNSKEPTGLAMDRSMQQSLYILNNSHLLAV